MPRMAKPLSSQSLRRQALPTCEPWAYTFSTGEGMMDGSPHSLREVGGPWEQGDV